MRSPSISVNEIASLTSTGSKDVNEQTLDETNSYIRTRRDTLLSNGNESNVSKISQSNEIQEGEYSTNYEFRRTLTKNDTSKSTYTESLASNNSLTKELQEGEKNVNYEVNKELTDSDTSTSKDNGNLISSSIQENDKQESKQNKTVGPRRLITKRDTSISQRANQSPNRRQTIDIQKGKQTTQTPATNRKTSIRTDTLKSKDNGKISGTINKKEIGRFKNMHQGNNQGNNQANNQANQLTVGYESDVLDAETKTSKSTISKANTPKFKTTYTQNKQKSTKLLKRNSIKPGMNY